MLIDEVSIETTAVILWLARQGYTITAIASELDYRDVEPPTTGKVLRSGEPVAWSFNLVKQVILKNLGSKPKLKSRYHSMYVERQMMFLKDHRCMTYRDIADYLNECGTLNTHLGDWNAESVKKVISRYRAYCTENNLDPFAPYPQVCLPTSF
jgi:hypothetical protein